MVITSAGNFDGPKVDSAAVKVGHIWHVETLAYVDTRTGERTVVHTGICGLVDETTNVTALAYTGSGSMTRFALVAGGVLLLGVIGVIVAARARRKTNLITGEVK